MIILKWIPLLLILPLPWILRAVLPRASSHDSALLRVPFFNSVNDMANRRDRNRSGSSRSFRLLLILIWVSLVIAAAGPQYIGEPVSITSKARDLMLAVDVSESMRATDLQLKGERVDRLTVVKSVLDEFIERRTQDRMGLILFGSDTPSSPGPTNPPGLNGRLEMEALAAMGFSPAAILKAATTDNARIFGLQGRGCLNAGCRGDALLLSDNPLRSVAAYDAIDLVILGGRPLDPAALSARNAPQ